MAFRDFLNKTKKIILGNAPSLPNYKNLEKHSPEKLLYDLLRVDLRVAAKRDEIHAAGAYSLARTAGLGINEATDAFEKLKANGFVDETDTHIIVFNALGEPSQFICARAALARWLSEGELKNSLTNIEKTKAPYLYKNKDFILKIFEDAPFWFYNFASAVVEYAKACTKKTNNTEISMTSIRSRFGAFEEVVEQYIKLFDKLPSKSEWDWCIIKEFSSVFYATQPQTDGAVQRFYELIENGDFCPLGKKIELIDFEKQDYRAEEIARFEKMHENISVLAKNISVQGLNDYIVLSGKLLQYARTYPSSVYSLCCGRPYETVQIELLKYLEDWKYYNEEAKKNVSNMLMNVAIPTVQKHYEKFIEARTEECNASVQALTDLLNEGN